MTGEHMDFERFDKAERDQLYISGMRPLFKKQAVFSDMTQDYVRPAQPAPYSTVQIRIRAAHNNVDRIFLIYKDNRYQMYRGEQIGEFDYYEYTLQLDNEEICYYFEIFAGAVECFYDQRGVVKQTDPHYYFKVIPGFDTPDWAKGAVMYQIFADRFYNGDPSNDVLDNEYHYIGGHTTQVKDWNKYPAQMGVREFYGGDLQGVLDKLDYLQDLGVEVIYFNPLFVSPSNHKYDIQDYDYIDPHLGKIVMDEGKILQDWEAENRFSTRYINRVTNKANLEASNAFFAQVVEEIHKRGMRVILDGVFNHCGSFNKWMDRERIYEDVPGYEKGAFVSKDSPYHNFFQFMNPDNFPYNPHYDGWWGHDTLPKLNYEGSKELYDYIMGIAAKWVSPPYNCDGWRLDVAADLGHSPEFNHQFWRDFRKAVREANPNALILAEHYGDPVSWLDGKQWDSVMNYDAFMEPITWFLTGMEKHSDDFRQDMIGNTGAFWGSMIYNATAFSYPSAAVAMNELSNHDHSRFLTRTNHKVGRTNTLGPEAANEGVNKAVMREAVVMQMTWPGAPTIYYGDEAGVCGFTDPDNRRTYPWGHEDRQMIDLHKHLIRIHKENPEIRDGSLRGIFEDYNVLVYARFNTEEQTLVCVNNNPQPVTRQIKVWEVGIPKETVLIQIFSTDEQGFSTEQTEVPVVAGKMEITIPATGTLILKHGKAQAEDDEKAEKSPIRNRRWNFVKFS